MAGLLGAFRQSAASLPDSWGRNKRYALADAASCTLSVFFSQAPSFLEFQRRMQRENSRSNCHTLSGVQAIPSDNRIRELLDGLDTDRFAERFPLCLNAVREQGALTPFERLGVRLLVALYGIQTQCSDSIHCVQCSIRCVGAQQREQDFHSMLSATVVADGRNRVLPLMAAFVQPQQDPAADRPELSEEQRKQDCERNAAKRWLPAHIDELRPYRPAGLGDGPYRCQSLCRPVPELGADFLFVCKPGSGKRVYELLHDDFIHSSSWLKTRNRHQQVERQRFRWMNGLPARDSDDAVMGLGSSSRSRATASAATPTLSSPSLQVTADNLAAIARAGRPRWKIENEGFHCLARQGYNRWRNVGHGSNGLANLLAILNPFAFALHVVLDFVSELWRQGRAYVGPRRKFFAALGSLTEWFCFSGWTVLFETVARKRLPTSEPHAAAFAPS